ncbi:hypothetical protein Pint_13476 [Pistacia integerrima]|uniref:Uncharacterized protein n=1 Tax=Pistacia integerrima TaxID=434235 RepID=A0ACC0Y5V8_9ROSI|nr:hypothetical protein Pint_13476 [Pistacia integerrima]
MLQLLHGPKECCSKTRVVFKKWDMRKVNIGNENDFSYSTVMESDPSNKPNAPRKMRFAPKAPPLRVPKAEVKTEVENAETASAQARDLLRRFNENQGNMKTKPKFEKKGNFGSKLWKGYFLFLLLNCGTALILFILKYAVASSQIAFGYGGGSTSIKSYGVPKGGGSSNRAGLNGLTEEKEYKEPWDYYSYYPVTLPLRRPYSGSPELLDEEEFGDTSETMDYDESSMKPAEELGLIEENLEASMFFLQLPPTMPMKKRSTTGEGQEATGSSKPHGGKRTMEKTCSLDELPAGFMGKMLVYKSGAVKLKLGDTLYDVTPGLDCMFAQDVVAINKAEKYCCIVGELDKRAILTPDVDSVLSGFADM